MKLNKILILFLPLILLVKSAEAHCPLCTVGAAAAAGGAAWLGVSKIIIGVFIGAFAVSMGMWISNVIKYKIPFKRPLLVLLSFATTILPILPIIKSEYFPVYLSLAGDYGSLLNRTYIFNLFLLGSIIGGFVVAIAPWLSKKISGFRNGKLFPYQGVLLTLVLLIITSLIIELIIII